MTYTRCPVCKGTLMMDVGCLRRPCICENSRTPGWSATGLTMGQIERMVEREMALKGDHGIPLEKRKEVIAKLNSDIFVAMVRNQDEGGRS
jgi:hypothetical protein